MRKILGKNNILESKEIGFSHKRPHFLMDQVNIVLCLNYPIQIYVHHDIERIIYVCSDKGKDQFENFGSDVELHLTNINPFKRCF